MLYLVLESKDEPSAFADCFGGFCDLCRVASSFYLMPIGDISLTSISVVMETSRSCSSLYILSKLSLNLVLLNSSGDTCYESILMTFRCTILPLLKFLKYRLFGIPAVKYSELFCWRFQFINDYLRFSLFKFNCVSCCLALIYTFGFLLLSYSFSFLGLPVDCSYGFEPIKSSRKLVAASTYFFIS